MEQEIIRLATSQGLWAVLFVALLFYVLRENAKREERLLSCLDNLTREYDSLSREVNIVKGDVCEIKEDVKDLMDIVK